MGLLGFIYQAFLEIIILNQEDTCIESNQELVLLNTLFWTKVTTAHMQDDEMQ